MVSLEREELAWAAGFWDGEGCTYLDRQYKPALCFSIAQGEKSTLERFNRAILGLARQVDGPYKVTKSDQPTYRLKINKFELIQASIAMLWPWLSQPKKDQYIRCVKEHLESRK